MHLYVYILQSYRIKADTYLNFITGHSELLELKKKHIMWESWMPKQYCKN